MSTHFRCAEQIPSRIGLLSLAARPSGSSCCSAIKPCKLPESLDMKFHYLMPPSAADARLATPWILARHSEVQAGQRAPSRMKLTVSPSVNSMSISSASMNHLAEA